MLDRRVFLWWLYFALKLKGNLRLRDKASLILTVLKPQRVGEGSPALCTEHP